jgi:formamidopyrimidine-DNA glycosylase
MPELPEVETVVKGLKDKIIGKQIESVTELRVNTLYNHTDENVWDCSEVIIDITRRGKYILINVGNRFNFVVHLRMTGKLVYAEHEQISPHTRAVINFRDNTLLQFEDIRTFGSIKAYNIDATDPAILKLGPEPLLEEFNANYLSKVLQKKKSPIKTILLDQTVIAGLGNIYVCELLYRINIHPLTLGNRLTKAEVKRVITATKEVLAEALIHNGTSISDFRNIDDKPGSFQKFLRVYQKKQCPKGHAIERIKIGGRSTFFCPICQKSK